MLRRTFLVLLWANTVRSLLPVHARSCGKRIPGSVCIGGSDTISRSKSAVEVSWASMRGGSLPPPVARRKESRIVSTTMRSSPSSVPLVLISTSSETSTMLLCSDLAMRATEGPSPSSERSSNREAPRPSLEELVTQLLRLSDGAGTVHLTADEYLAIEAAAAGASSLAARDALSWLLRGAGHPQKLVVLVNDGQGYASAPRGKCSSSASLAALRAATTYEVAVSAEDASGAAAWDAVQAMRELVTGFAPGTRTERRRAVALEMGPDTFFLSTTVPHVADLVPHLPAIEQSVDFIELRADLLRLPDEEGDIKEESERRTSFILDQIAQLRRATEMPILFTVRSACQCGTFPDDPRAIVALAEVGLRGGVDWLDIEACWGEPITEGGDDGEESQWGIVSRWAGRAAQRLRRRSSAGPWDEQPHKIRCSRRRRLLGDDVEGLVRLAASRYPSTRLLGSTHVVGRPTSRPTAARLFERCGLSGRADGAKVVLTAFSEDDTTRVVLPARDDAALPCPAIAICLGEAGKISRVLNRPFTPVCHEALGAAAAPGQMSATDIMAERRALFLAPKRYYLVGSPIGKSPSPDMHNAAFERIGLPHVYGLCDTLDVAADFAVGDGGGSGDGSGGGAPPLLSPDFGGCSVTIPHKQAIIPFLDEITPAAKVIGAVNTVTKLSATPQQREAKREARLPASSSWLVGDNTDWLGMLRPIERALRTTRALRTSGNGNGNNNNNQERADNGIVDMEAAPFGMVIGAGGTARAAVYALRVGLGLPVVIYNRSPDKARALAQELQAALPRASRSGNGDDIRGVASTADLSEAAVMSAVSDATSRPGSLPAAQSRFALAAVISTVPASAEFTLPDWAFASSTASTQLPSAAGHRPVVLDVVYKPPLTTLVQQARGAGLTVVPGATMLVEQGVEQSERWTGRSAPRKVMFRAVWNNIMAGYEGGTDAERAEVDAFFQSLPDWNVAAAPSPYQGRKIVMLFGPPAAGKGTHGPRIEEAFGLPTLSTGDMLRQAVADETPVGLQAKEVMAAGKLVSDEIVINIVKDRTSKEDCSDGFILDGFPRTVEQAKALDAILAATGEKVTCVLALEVPDDVLESRITGRWVHKASGRSYHTQNNPPKSLPKGAEPTAANMLDDETGQPLMQRADDTKEALKDRLQAYHSQTVPILAHYAPTGVVVRADANRPMDAVWKTIASSLGILGRCL